MTMPGTITIDPETKEYIVTNGATGVEEGRFPRGSYSQAQTLDAQVNGPANEGDEEGEDSGVPIAGQAGPRLPLELRPRLKDWNEQAKKQGLAALSESHAADARAWEYVGFTFEESLNAYSRWMSGEAGVPAPTGEAIKAWIDETKAREIPYYVAAPTPPTGLPAGAEQTEVGKAILAVTDDPAVQAAMWHAAGSEGGYQGPWGTGAGGPSVGDSGDAVGPWQVNFGPRNDPNRDGIRERPDGTHITREQAADPAQSAAWMLSEFEAAIKAVPAELWQTDPGGAVAMATAMAERPTAWNDSAKTVEDAVAIYGRPDTGPIAPGATTPGTIRTMPTEGEEGVKVTDADRLENTLYDLGLSAEEMKTAKQIGYSLAQYAEMKTAAEILDTTVGGIMQRVRGGESLDEIVNQAEFRQLHDVIQAAPIGTTEAERTANFRLSQQEGLTMDETAAAVAAGIPIPGLGTVKEQLAELATSAPAGDVPTWEEALVGAGQGMSPFDVMQATTTAREAQRMGFTAEGGTAIRSPLAGKSGVETYAAAKALGEGDVQKGYEQLKAIEAGLIKPDESQMQYIIRRSRAGRTADEIMAAIVAQTGEPVETVAARYPRAISEFRPTTGGLAGGIGVFPGRTPSYSPTVELTPEGRGLFGQRLTERLLKLTEGDKLLPYQTPAERLAMRSTLEKAAPALSRRISEEYQPTKEEEDRRRLEVGLRQTKSTKRKKPPAGFRTLAT